MLGGGIIPNSLSIEKEASSVIYNQDNKHIALAQKLILLSVFSCFTYQWVARVIIVATVLTFMFLPGIRKIVFSKKSSFVVLAFSVLGWIVSLCYVNIN